MLVALVDAVLEVAVVADAQRRRPEALRQVERHRVADLLVDRTREAVVRTVPPEPEGEMLRCRPRLLLSRVVGLDEPVRLAPWLARELDEPRRIARLELLVGVEPEDPVAGRRLDADVARLGEVAGPLEVQNASAERLGDLHRPIARARVDDDHLRDRLAARLEAGREHLLLVAHDHAERDAARGRLRSAPASPRARARAAAPAGRSREANGSARARGGADACAPPRGCRARSRWWDRAAVRPRTAGPPAPARSGRTPATPT